MGKGNGKLDKKHHFHLSRDLPKTLLKGSRIPLSLWSEIWSPLLTSLGFPPTSGAMVTLKQDCLLISIALLIFSVIGNLF